MEVNEYVAKFLGIFFLIVFYILFVCLCYLIIKYHLRDLEWKLHEENDELYAKRKIWQRRLYLCMVLWIISGYLSHYFGEMGGL
ncbi:MAG: hypothetical protein J0M25_13875, partial [Flavobacteriales bacterium]|nr:hypothetical protein [Flavobacteriales bacterium]